MGLTKEEQRDKIRKQKKVEKGSVRPKNKKMPIIHESDSYFVKGIYFLYQGKTIVYIGQSKTNVMLRICSHFADESKTFTRFSFQSKKSLSDIKLNQLEKRLIIKHKPIYNTIYKNKPNKRVTLVLNK